MSSKEDRIIIRCTTKLKDDFREALKTLGYKSTSEALRDSMALKIIEAYELLNSE